MLEIIGKLKQIGKLINTQDNRMTDQPMFIVQKKVLDYGYDSEYSDLYEWTNIEDREEIPTDALTIKLDQMEYGCEDTGDWERCYYQERWEFVTACFTEQGCKDYLKINRHNLEECRIYAESSFRNEEYKTIRKYLMDLVDE